MLALFAAVAILSAGRFAARQAFAEVYAGALETLNVQTATLDGVLDDSLVLDTIPFELDTRRIRISDAPDRTPSPREPDLITAIRDKLGASLASSVLPVATFAMQMCESGDRVRFQVDLADDTTK